MYNVNKIFELLRTRNLTQKALCEAISISSGNLSDWKSGKSKPSQRAQVKIAEFFDLPLSYFYSFDTPMPDTDDKIQRLLNISEDLSDEELRLLAEYADFLKSKRNI